MEELQSPLPAPSASSLLSCHVCALGTDGRAFPVSSGWVLVVLAPTSSDTAWGSLMAPGPLQFPVTFFFFSQERNPCPDRSMAVLFTKLCFISKLCLKVKEKACD